MNTEPLFETNFHWSNEVITTTVIFMAIILFVIASLWIKHTPPVWRYFLTITLLGSIIYSVSLTPKRLLLYSGEIKVKKIIGSIDLPIDQIESVSLAGNRTDNSIRTFASGGVCGYLGVFKNNTLGRYEMYATEMKDLILIETKDKKYVFNCKNPETLIATFDSLTDSGNSSH